jgi:hypothetical protein
MGAYGAAPTYDDTELQRFTLTGRLKVAEGIRDRYVASGDEARARRWTATIDQLLDRLLEVRGR